MKSLGIDLGGTQVKLGVVEEGVILRQFTCDTRVIDGYETVIEMIAGKVRELISEYPDVGRIGLGSPGLIDMKAGRILYSNNFGWNDKPVCRDLGEMTGKPVRIANDAQCAALGEALYGAGRGMERVAMFTLGTGVGGGFVRCGRLEEDGYGSMAYIFGHQVIAADGRSCNCGRHGCLECYASASAVAEHGSQLYGALCSAKEVFERARNGEEAALSAVETFLEALGTGVVNVANILRPQVIVIGGGVSASCEMILPRLNEELERGVYGYSYAPVRAVAASLGNQAGIMGASGLL